MKKDLLLYFLLLINLKLSSQNLSCIKIENYPSISFSDYFQKKPNFFFQGEKIVFLDQFTLTRFTPHDEAKKINLESLIKKSDSKYISEKYGFTYLLTDSFLIIKNRNHVFLFNYSFDKIKYDRHIELSQNCGRNIFKCGNKIYFYEIYNYHELDNKIPSGFLSFDLKNGKVEIQKIDFKYLSITHIWPNNFIDFSKNGYIVCDPLKYRLYEYDFNNILLDSLTIDDSLFTASNSTHFTTTFNQEKVSKNASSYLENMTSYLNTIDRIWTINYIDENTLFVRLTRNSLKSGSTRGQLFYDHIWQRKKEDWKLIQIKEISSFKDTQTISENDLWPHFFPGARYTCNDGSLYYTLWSSSQNTFPQVAKSFYGFEATDRAIVGLKLMQFKIE